MKDEIKEIERILATSGKYITYAERNYVLDYITNLQEENKKSFEKGYAEGIIVAELDNENEFIVAYKELKQRIDKAIEYINKKWKKNKYYQDIENCLTFCDFDKDELLNILNSGEEVK